MITTIHNSTVHVLNILDQILLHLSAVTTIVSPVIMERILMNMLSYNYVEDPLWDGAGCPSENSCCYDAGMPWFLRQFPTSIIGDIEVRICHDSNYGHQNVMIEQLLLYIR